MRKKRTEIKKLKKNWYWFVIAVIIIILIIVTLVWGNKIFGNWQKTPKQSPCVADVTTMCSNGSMIILQSCVEGKLVSTGNVCPCIANTTLSCSDGSTIVTQECVDGRLIGTGKVCPCYADNVQTCYDGTNVTIQTCVNKTLISTGKFCPQPPAPKTIELTASRLQTLFQRSDYFKRLPSNTAVALSFYDGLGKMRSEKFFISEGGAIKNYGGEGYDLEFTMGDYRVPELESASDLCAGLTKVKNDKDLRVTAKNILSLGKYFYLKSCVSF